MPSVSIIIPAHNPGPFLREAIESVHAQSFQDWELIVVDDASKEELDWVIADYPRVKLIRQDHGGVSIARNNGILNTSGDLIAFMDQDDLWLPNKLHHQVAVMVRSRDIAMCYCDLEFVGPNGERLSLEGSNCPIDYKIGDYVLELDGSSQADQTCRESKLHTSILHFKSRFAVPSTVMIRRSYLATTGLLDPFIPFTGDYDLIVKIGARHKVARVPSVDVHYRRHSNNFSNQYEVCRSEVEALIGKYGSFARGSGDMNLAKSVTKLFRGSAKNYSAQAFDRARQSLHGRQFKQFAIHLVRAFLWNPVYVTKSVTRGLGGRTTIKSRNVA